MPAALRWLLRLAPLNPIVVRLVQGGSRRQRHNLIRSAYLAVLIAVLIVLLLPQQGQLNYQVLAVKGAAAFEMVAYLQIALICILSPVFMAGAIAQESNPKTWEVLLTTPLTSLQMVLGHLCGRLFFVLALLIASLPLFAITQFFGGVPGSSILLSYAVAGCAALLVGAVAVSLAVSRMAGRRAVFAFYVSVVTFLAVTIAIDYAIGAGAKTTVVTPLNPFLALRALLNPAGYVRPDPIDIATLPWIERLWLGDPVGAWCLLSAGISLLLIAVSTLTLRAVGTLAAGGVPWYRRMLGLGSARTHTRAPREVWKNPIAWREGASRQATFTKILIRWSFIAAGALWGVGIIAAFHEQRLGFAGFRIALLVTAWTELAVIVLVAINVSATAISREREDGTLDLLLTTPITPAVYLGGKLRGLISYLTPLLLVPIGTVALAGLYVLVGGLGRSGGVEVTDVFGVTPVVVPVVLPEAGLILPLVAIPFTALCVMIGLQWSMKSRGTIGSVVATVGVIGVVAGIAGMCGFLVGSSLQFVGPALAAATPINALLALILPADAYSQSVSSAAELNAARIALVVGAFAACAIDLLIVYGLRSNMSRTFDMAVRRLAGAA